MSAASASVVSWQCVALGAAAAGCASGRVSGAGLPVSGALIAPEPPAGLSSSVNGQVVRLTWVAPFAGDAATSYVVEAGSASGQANLASFDTGNAGLVLTVTDVPPGTYYVRVRGRNPGGTGASSNEIVVAVGGSPPAPCGVPGAPTGLVSSSTGTSVSLSWTASSSACAPTGYQIEAGSAPGASNLANLNTGSTATTFSAIGVATGIYYVRVRAANSSGTSAPSNESTLIVGGLPSPTPNPTPPPAPTPTTVDVTPRSADLGTPQADGCHGASFSRRFEITVPPDVSWNVGFCCIGNTASFARGSLDRSSGTGTGSVTYTVTLTPTYTTPSYPYTCNDYLQYRYGDTLTFSFARGATLLPSIDALFSYTYLSQY